MWCCFFFFLFLFVLFRIAISILFALCLTAIVARKCMCLLFSNKSKQISSITLKQLTLRFQFADF
eukprot:m.336110 g.336110  ORF g.336110 m.336110 type:complete len:65 (+) comp16078_c1_seq1:156-350(+)